MIRLLLLRIKLAWLQAEIDRAEAEHSDIESRLEAFYARSKRLRIRIATLSDPQDLLDEALK